MNAGKVPAQRALFPRLNVLISYAFLRGNAVAFKMMAEAFPDVANLLIDSGAFTNKKEVQQAAKLGKKADIVTLAEYNDACRRWHGRAEYIQLDVIGDPVGTAENLQRTLDAGLQPIPVFTPGAKWETLGNMVAVCGGRVCFGGIGAYGKAGVSRLAERAHQDTGGKIKTHLLGYGMYPVMMALPIATCDSSSYTAGGKFGTVLSFDPYTGITTTSWNELKAPSDKSRKLLGLLRQYNIPISEMEKTGNYVKVSGIPAMSAVYSYLKLAEHVERVSGVRYYLAAVNMQWTTPIVAVLSSLTPGGFDYPKAREIKLELDALNRAHEHAKLIYTCLDLLRQHTAWEVA